MFSWNRKLAGKPMLRQIRPSRKVHHCLQIEKLEDRTVPSFFTSPNFAVGGVPQGAAVADFNGDGKADLVVVNNFSNTMSVLLGNGDGTFQPKIDYATGTAPVGVAVGDFNGDGKLDVVVANQGASSLSLFLGTGTGGFLPKTDIVLPLIPYALTVADFNGDGKADIAVSTQNHSLSAPSDDMTLLLGNGNGTFQTPVSTVTDTIAAFQNLNAGGLNSIQSADFNGDGRLDLVMVNNKDTWARVGRGQTATVFPALGSVSVLLGNGDGSFQAPRNFGVGIGAKSVAVGDFNGDGRPDFAVNSNSAFLNLFMNAGGGNFAASNLNLPAAPTNTLAAGDFNGDGVMDLAFSMFVATPTGTNVLPILRVYNGQVGGTLQAAGPTYVQNLGFPIVGDLNGDGHPDLAGVVNPGGSGAVSAWLNNGNGTFPAPSLTSSAGVTFSSQASADFNSDGIADLVTSTGQVELGLGDGRFGDTITLAFPSTQFTTPNTVAAVDADGNGTIDILVNNANFYPTGQAAVWYNSPGYDSHTGGAVAFTMSAPSQITAGDNTSVTVTAVDSLGNPVPGFLGTVDLDFTPAGSTALNLAGQYTFTAADNGRHTFIFSNVTQVGAGTLSVHAAAMPTATSPLTVVPAALSQFAFAGPGSIPAGTPFSFTISPEDRFGNIETGYTGTVHFSALANDTQAVLPPDYTFTATDAGTHSFSATLFKTAGASSPFINTKDLATGVNSYGAIVVTPLAPAALSMSTLPSPYTAGTQVGVAVTAVDIYGNRATSYTGTVHVSSTDAKASLPADYTYTAADFGTHTFQVALKTAGTQSFTAADTANSAFSITQSNIVVVPAAASVFAFSGLPTNATAGSAQTFTVTAEDAFGNVAPYFGTVSFSSTDSQAVLPGFYTFTTADASSHTFTATFKTAGAQSLTVADFFYGTPTGTQSITITPAAAAALQLTGFPTSTTAGVAHNFTVTARDSFGNVATSYTGMVAFSSSDPIASLPANYTFTAADAGVHVFSAALKRAGAQFIEAVDTLTSSIFGSESGMLVSAAAVSQFAISGPTSVTQGVGFKITVSAEDAYGNVNAGYRGTVHLSSTDSTGGTQNFTFSNNDNGVHIFSYTFNALGFQTINIVDTSNSSIFGSITEDVLPK